MKKATLFLLLLVLVIPVFAQQTQEELVIVPKKYVSAEGLNHLQSTSSPKNVAKWAGVGKEVGIAVREGLDAVVDKADKFGGTKVGTFVVVMIAWKVIAREVLGVLLGIPLLIGGIFLWVYIAERVFFGYRVLDRVEGKMKIYKDHNPIEFFSHDAKAFIAIMMAITLIVFIGLMVFVVIF